MKTFLYQYKLAMTPSTALSDSGTVILNPNYKIPIGLVLIGLALCFLSRWLGIPIALFGIFLAIQAMTLRLHFTPDALEIYRSAKQIRRFPFAEWQYWEIYWSPVPILFYFREVKSIHFLPIVFDPNSLRSCLELRYPLQKTPETEPS
jgi:hypothetical protein